MNNPRTITSGPEKKITYRDFGFDPLIVIKILTKYWYVFGISIVVAFMVGRYYITHTMPVYMVSTTILIYDDDNRNSSNNDELLQGLGLPGGMRSLDNQKMILTSRELAGRVLDELNFEVEYYYKTVRNVMPFYPLAPAKLVYKGKNPLPKRVEFSIKYLNEDEFILDSELPGFNIQAKFGELIETQNGEFKVECINHSWFKSNPEVNLNFVVHTRESLIRFFNSRMEVEPLSRSGSIMSISLNGTNARKDVDFLNKLTSVFQQLSLEKKNDEANRRIQFIDSQIVGIKDSLIITENQLEAFRSSHRVMDLSVQGRAIITQVTELEREKARLQLETNYYNDLSKHLKDEITEDIPLPMSMGIDDPVLTSQVAELLELEEQLSSQGAGEKNPLQNLLNQRVKNTKEALKETLKGLRRANNLAISENQRQIARVNSQASILPTTERQMLGIERKFKLNDELYTYLLEKRSELLMQKASNRPDNEVIDSASTEYSMQVAPNSNMIYFLSLFAGAGIPLLILFLLKILNNKLQEEDLKRYTSVPIVGSIPHFKNKSETEVLEHSESNIAESYRLMRSRLQFITKEKINPVILITSPTPDDGKTITSINVASVYSLLGKKTVLVGFDLRNPSIEDAFHGHRKKGVSTFLIGRDNIDDIIQATQFKNLSVISAGPIPPNPSELTASNATGNFFDLLRERFEYIVVDSAPIGMISDTHHITPYADANLLVIRIKKTRKDMIDKSLFEFDSHGNNNVCLVVNDVVDTSSPYGYGKKRYF